MRSYANALSLFLCRNVVSHVNESILGVIEIRMVHHININVPACYEPTWNTIEIVRESNWSYTFVLSCLVMLEEFCLWNIQVLKWHNRERLTFDRIDVHIRLEFLNKPVIKTWLNRSVLGKTSLICTFAHECTADLVFPSVFKTHRFPIYVMTSWDDDSILKFGLLAHSKYDHCLCFHRRIRYTLG